MLSFIFLRNIGIKMNWTLENLQKFYEKPLFDLIYQAQKVHRTYHQPNEVQVCTLISVKTGGCPENCNYCAQSSRFNTGLQAQPLMKLENVLQLAKEAKRNGATRVCLGAAWREVRNNQPFNTILTMVKEISALGLEVCCTLGMLNEEQALKLKEAGAFAYNHNLDTSKDYYSKVVTTRTYQDRIDTLETAKKSGLSLCSGGILGLGETVADRLKLLLSLSKLNPSSVPINRLAQISGTPFENHATVSIWEMIRMIALARILMPQTMVRLSAGRMEMTLEQQALCFLAGANSIFSGEKLLTVENPTFEDDDEMFALFGLTKRPAFAN